MNNRDEHVVKMYRPHPQKNVKNTKAKKDKNKIKKKSKTINIWPIVFIIAVLIFIVYKIFGSNAEETPKIELSGRQYYQYFLGIKDEYSGEIKLEEDNKGEKLILADKRVVYLDSTPIFYKEEFGKALLPKEMALIAPNEDAYGLLKFTNIVRENNGVSARKFNSNKSVDISHGFLFDGNNLYVFLEETKITVGSKEFTIPALSYVIVNDTQSVEIYDYTTDRYTIISDTELLQNNVIATNSFRNYSVNMSTCAIATRDYEKELSKNISKLKVLEY